jgi:hypothetical protein
MKRISILILIVLISLRGYPQKHERWDVKTLTDGFIPDTSHVKKVTVAKIQPIPKVRIRNTQTRLNFEKQVIKITGTITRIQLEKGSTAKPGDMDYHIEVTDGTMGDSTFVCEAVNPDDDGADASPYVSNFKKVRTLAEHLKVGDKVTFTGMLFQDKYHSPSQLRTRNFLEMHPILKAKKI